MNKIISVLGFWVLSMQCLHAQDPDWSVDYSQFPFRMSVSAVIEREGGLLEQGENKVAAFVGGEIRGIGYADSFHEPSGRYLAIFQIGSRVAQGEQVTFKIYDEMEDAVVEGRFELAFVADQLVGSVSDPYVISDNRYPTAVTVSTTRFEENLASGEVICTLEVSDGDDDSHVLGLSDFDPPAASSLIAISGSSIVVSQVANYEMLSAFSVRLTATDVLGASVSVDLDFDVTNLEEAPTDITLSQYAITENNSPQAVVALIATADEDRDEMHSYFFTPVSQNEDTAFFVINGSQLKVNTVLDHESRSEYQLLISSEDKFGLTFSKALTLSVLDENEAPQISEATFGTVENVSVGSSLGTLTFSDPDVGQTLTLEMLTTGLPFSMDPVSGALTVTGAINYEAATQYAFDVKVTDDGTPSLSSTQSLVMAVTDENEPPSDVTLSEIFISENLDVGSLVGELEVDDQDASERFSYEILATENQQDHTYFELIDNQLITKKQIDKESLDSYSLDVRVRDKAGHQLEKTLFVFVTDQNEQPRAYDTLWTVSEEHAVGMLVGQIEAYDPDAGQQLSYELRSTLSDLPFEMDPVTGAVSLTEVLDYESRSDYYLSVSIVDDGVPSLEEVISLHVRLTDINEAPTRILISGQTLLENRNSGALVGTLETLDADQVDFHSYEIIQIDQSPTNNAFVVLDNKLFANQLFDYETQSSYQVEIKSWDKGGLSVSEKVEILIEDTNEAPVVLDAVFSVRENTAFGHVVGQLQAIDQDHGQQLTYTFLEDGAGVFALDDVSGEISVNMPEVLDYEQTISFSFEVVVEDDGEPILRDTCTVSVEVEDLPEAELPIRNYISPNGDGFNDFLTIENPEVYEGFVLHVMNARGVRLYSKANYDNSWDGYYRGAVLPVGVYYYLFENINTGVRYQGQFYIKDR
ncbi:cadherin domain-containing protein [Reichenbachiella agariperforans]|uniref:cadherin domain-containing protein n=1 Tax=Reichenbachiella agariperforans TaxID=156994 RepID=UPI001C082147|nr:cadherin domain-containing protein [Reichenbachiella agariperforans]